MATVYKPAGFAFAELLAFGALSVARESAVNGQVGQSGQRFATGQEAAGVADGRAEVAVVAVGVVAILEVLVGLQSAFEDDHRRRFLFGSRRRRRHGPGRTPSLSGGQHQTPRDRHDDDHVVQAHSRHVHQVYGQNFIPDLISNHFNYNHYYHLKNILE